MATAAVASMPKVTTFAEVAALSWGDKQHPDRSTDYFSLRNGPARAFLRRFYPKFDSAGVSMVHVIITTDYRTENDSTLSVYVAQNPYPADGDWMLILE